MRNYRCGNHCYHQQLSFDANPENVEHRFNFTHQQEPFSLAKFHIAFNFTCQFFIDAWARHVNAGEPIFIRRITAPGRATNVHFTTEDTLLINPLPLLTTLKVRLRPWPIGREMCRELMMFALKTARRAIQSMPDSCNAVEIQIPVALLHWHMFDVGSAVELASQGSMEETEVRMVPSAELSIECLERVEVPTDYANTCGICLEEINGGCEATAMACFHVFHDNCIKQWLRISHYCPLCRFQMPTN